MYVRGRKLELGFALGEVFLVGHGKELGIQRGLHELGGGVQVCVSPDGLDGLLVLLHLHQVDVYHLGRGPHPRYLEVVDVLASDWLLVSMTLTKSMS